ncbi:MAG: pyruvate dehydrogenase complex dihydrolipoamide acetyltransferase [Myxococcales bacterium]|nr:MAG: pyruvate dehydrogenase complex dihydrolipoamide acetyltransferase [Myxococcales bacterium]
MAKIIGLPKLSPTMDEGTLVRWVKQEGEAVDTDDLLAEVETDKATMEFRSFDKGVLLKQLAPEGAVLSPDEPVAIIGDKSDDITKLIEEAKKHQPSSGAASEASGSQSKAADKSEAQNQSSAPSTSSVSQAAAPSSSVTSSGRIKASPLVRKLANEQGINLHGVAGTGPGGRIIKRDLQGVSGGAGYQIISGPPKVVPLSQMRKTIARRLTQSKQEIPHFYLTIDVDSDALWAARQQINTELEERGQKVSVNDIIIKASAKALRKVPAANASFMGDSIHYHNRVDISVAVAVLDGLVTPVIRSADTKPLAVIANEVRELAKRAKDKKLKPEEMQDGTFSISNLGMYGIESFSAVINPPEGAILAVGAVRQEPIARDGQLLIGRRMRMTLSCDHRVVDGAVGAEFLAALRYYLEQPLALFV